MGVDVQILDENQKEITDLNKEGYVVLKGPGPLTACVGFWNNKSAFIDQYYSQFPGYFRTGDVGIWDENHCLKFIRREEEILFLQKSRCCARIVQ